MEAAWSEMKVNISLSNKINGTDAEVKVFHEKLRAALHTAVTRCRKERKRKLAGASAPDLSDEALRLAARHTDRLPLANYDGILHLVPRLVNVVTVNPAPEHASKRAQADTLWPLRSWRRPSRCRAAA